jgi:Nucleotide-diphospho-sugar transferase
MSDFKILNLEKFNAFVQTNKFTVNDSKIFLFTNSNYEYVITLVKNLYKSYTESFPLNLICTDRKGYDEAQTYINPKNVFLLELPDLPLSEQASESGTVNYKYLCFVKIICCYYILKLGIHVLYFDPDQVFINKRCVEITICHSMQNNMFSMCGVMDSKITVLNTNVIYAMPKHIEMFNVTKDEIKKHVDMEGGSDETYMEDKIKGGERTTIFMLNKGRFPCGVEFDAYKNTAFILHANCVKGLENKISFMKKYNLWLLDK